MIAHRAGNDLRRAEEAAAAGADVLEADVWLYRRGLELRHTKTARGLPILWDKWSLTHSFGPRLSLEAMLAAVPPKQGLLLDLKGNDRALAAAVLGELARRPRTGAVAVCSQNWGLLEPFADGPDGIALVHSIGGRRRLRRVLAGDAPPMRVVSIHERFLDGETIAALKRIAPMLISWHVNDGDRLHQLVQSGVDGLITDSLDLVREGIEARAMAVRAVGSPQR
jgi:glycerophosphoryl diester phosphodiesterase